MRLSEKQVEGLVKVLGEFLNGKKAELFLHGSRTDDRAKGGDIDLLLISSKETATSLKAIKYKILAGFDRELGEQKIDLTIGSHEDKTSNAFVKSILPKAILLKTF